MKLLTSQKDKLYGIIEEIGLSPSQFEFKDNQSYKSAGQRATGIYFKNSDFYFLFETGPNTIDTHYARFSPGEDSFVREEYPGSWDLQLNYFRKWISSLSKEINTPDKWSRLEKEMKNLDIKYELDSDKFTFSEYQDLSKRIRILQERIAEVGLSEEQVGIINKKLDFLLEKATDLSRFDWKSLFIGTILSIAIQLEVSEDNVKTLWSLIKEIFNQYLLN